MDRLRTLFLSISGTLSAIASGLITEADLNAGLFYFNGVDLSSIVQNATAGQEAELRLLIAAVTTALQQGRAGWARPFDSVEQMYWGLNRLLVANGQKTISFPNTGHYYQREIAACVTDMNVIIADELLD